MSIRQDIRELKTGPRDLRKFGLMVGGVFAGIGFLFLLRHKSSYPFFIWPGVALIVLCVLAPRSLKFPYIAWMTVAFAIGFVMARVLLSVCFFLLVTPIALIARLFGKDFLSRKWNRQTATYWIQCEAAPKNPESYEQQY